MAASQPEIDDSLNIADYFLDARIREGRGEHPALLFGQERVTYREVQRSADEMAHALQRLGVEPEQRVIIGLPDRPEMVSALFGILKLGAVVVMVNPELGADDLSYFYEYSRAKVAIVDSGSAPAFLEAMEGATHLEQLLLVSGGPMRPEFAHLSELVAGEDEPFETFPSRSSDPAIWLFSGGTTGKPKAVVQSHASFVNTTELYAKGVLGLGPDDITLSVPKLYFGYATGSNLLFPFSVGATSVLFADRSTPERVFELAEQHKATVLINVPTMIGKMVGHNDADRADLSSLRLSTSAGEALPEELYARWRKRWDVDLLDGLGTAEMWHIFISNRPGQARPGTLGQAVPGFDVEVRDDDGNPLPDGEVGWLWVRGQSRAIGYFQQHEKTCQAFRGEWYVTGDMVRRDEEGYFTYCGRGDDMLKVSGKWLAPKEVENCLLGHESVQECAVVGVTNADGLTKPFAFVRANGTNEGLAEALKQYVRDKLEPYKAPREVRLVADFPRTHLGKIDRGALRGQAT